MADLSHLEALAERQAGEFVSEVVRSMPEATSAAMLEHVTGIARIGFTTGYLVGYREALKHVNANVGEALR